MAIPAPSPCPSGQPVWSSRPATARARSALPSRTAATRAQTIFSLDHSWKGTHARWKHYDAWVPAKGPLTMGYFTRADLPFYYALADAFTICDAYHCSIFGPTNPNRLFLFSGTSGLSAGDDGKIVVANPPDEPTTPPIPRTTPRLSPASAGRPTPSGCRRRASPGGSIRSTTTTATTAWPISPISAAAPGLAALSARPRLVAGLDRGQRQDPEGEHLVAQFAADVAADRCRRSPGSSRPTISANILRPARPRARPNRPADRRPGLQPRGLGQDRLHPEL